MTIRTACLIVCMICSLAARSQKIDSIQTGQQALAYIKSLIYSQVLTELIHLDTGNAQYLGQHGASVFEKADFDGDGRTDLLFNGVDMTASPHTQSFIFFARDTLLPEQLTRKKGLNFFAARLISLDNTPAIVCIDNEQQDTVVYRDGAFLDRVNHQPLVFEKLKLCISGDDAYSLTLYRDSAWLDCYPFSLSSYCARLDHDVYKKLMECIDHTDWGRLEMRKPPHPFDVPSGCLSIVGTDGKIRHVRDFEFSDTHSLKELEYQLWTLHRDQKWVSTGETRSCLCDYYDNPFTPDQGTHIAHALDSLYRSLSTRIDTIYLADNINSKPDRDHNTYGYPDDELLKKLIDSGVEEIISPLQIQQWLLPHKVAIIGSKEFEAIKMPPLVLTRSEKNVFRQQDRVLRRWINNDLALSKKYSEEQDMYASKEYTLNYKRYQRQDSLLRADKNFQSAEIKRTKNVKRRLIFTPFLRYKDHLLMVMYYYTGYRHEADTIFTIIPI